MLDKWEKVIDYALGGLPVLIGALPSILNYLFPGFYTPEPLLNAILAAAGFFLGLFITGLVAWSRSKDPSQRSLPPPQWLWHLILNRLPTLQGRRQDKDTLVVLVHDPATLDTALRVKSHYEAGNSSPGPSKEVHDTDNQGTRGFLTIKLASLDPDTPKPLTKLRTFLREAHGVYFFWTTGFAGAKNKRRILEALNSWAHEQWQTPALLVDLDGLNPDSKFDIVPGKQFVEGLWLLLRRSQERAEILAKQSRGLHRLWIVTAIFAVATALCSGIWMYLNGKAQLQASEKKYHLDLQASEKMHHLDLNKFNQLAIWTDIRHANANGASIRAGSLVGSAVNFADFTLSEIVYGAGAPLDHNYQLSVFRDTRLESDVDAIKQMFWTGDRQPHPFSRGYKSIVACALSTQSFVLWRRNCANGETAAWKMSGEPNGQCDQAGNIRIQGFKTCEYGDVKEHIHREALLCFAPDLAGSKGGLHDTAVCFDVQNSNEGTATLFNHLKFLIDPWLRQKLQVFAAFAGSLSTEAIRKQ